MTSGQETEQVYSYNPGAHTGLCSDSASGSSAVTWHFNSAVRYYYK